VDVAFSIEKCSKCTCRRTLVASFTNIVDAAGTPLERPISTGNNIVVTTDGWDSADMKAWMAAHVLNDDVEPLAFDIIVHTWSVDLRLAMNAFLENILEPFTAKNTPVVLRHFDYTEDESGQTDILLQVTGPKFRPIFWSPEFSPFATRILMSDNNAWRCINIRTDIGDVMQTTFQHGHRLYWDGYCSSLGFGAHLTTLSRLTQFLPVEIRQAATVINRVMRLNGITAYSVNCAASDVAASLTIDTMGSATYGGISPDDIKSRFTMSSMSESRVMQFLQLCSKPLRFIIFHMPNLSLVQQMKIGMEASLPLMTSCCGRLYARHPDDKGREIIIQVMPWGKRVDLTPKLSLYAKVFVKTEIVVKRSRGKTAAKNRRPQQRRVTFK